MLKSWFSRPNKAAPTPTPATAIPPIYAPLFRADGTLRADQFERQVVPILEQVRKVASDADFQALLATITAALGRAANTRFPLDRPGADYRRFETIYNYAVIVVITTQWWLHHHKRGLEALEDTLTTAIPAEGLARLKREPAVWQDIRACITGEAADGGLRQVAGIHWQPAAPAPSGTPPIPPSVSAPQPSTNKRCEHFLTPHRSQWANPLTKGWVLVETIREGLRDGSLPYNRKQAWVQVDREGRTFLQVPEVFEWCYERLDAEVPPKTLVNQFGRLNICTRTRKGQNLLRGGRRNQKAYQQGFVVEDPNLFWDGEPPADQFYIRHLTRHGFGQSLQSPPDSAA